MLAPSLSGAEVDGSQDKKIIQTHMKNLSDHIKLLCDLLTSFLLREIHMGEILKLY
jgi:hypothetical protein